MAPHFFSRMRALPRWAWMAVPVLVGGGLAAWYLVAKPEAADPHKVSAIAQRCQIAMRRDVCGVMKASKPQSTQGRLFIAGIGEVDAQAFDRLQRAGEGMCQEVAQQCSAHWSGSACRIAQAMYPM